MGLSPLLSFFFAFSGLALGKPQEIPQAAGCNCNTEQNTNNHDSVAPAKTPAEPDRPKAAEHRRRDYGNAYLTEVDQIAQHAPISLSSLQPHSPISTDSIPPYPPSAHPFAPGAFLFVMRYWIYYS